VERGARAALHNARRTQILQSAEIHAKAELAIATFSAYHRQSGRKMTTARIIEPKPRSGSSIVSRIVMDGAGGLTVNCGTLDCGLHPSAARSSLLQWR